MIGKQKISPMNLQILSDFNWRQECLHYVSQKIYHNLLKKFTDNKNKDINFNS